MSRFSTLAVFALVLAAGAAYVVPRLRLDSELASLVPVSSSDSLSLGAARALATGPSSRLVAFEVRGASPADAWAASERVDAVVRGHRSVASIASASVPTELAAFVRLVDEHPAALGGEVDPLGTEQLDEAASRLREFLSTPFSADHRGEIPRDPLLDRLRAFDRLAGAMPARRNEVREGRLVADGGRAVLDSLSLRPDATTERVRDLVDSVERAARPAQVRWSGVAPITARTTEAIRGDVERVSTFSTIGVFLLLGIAFGRLRYVAIAALPLAAATVFGLAAGLFVYGRVHGIALAFAGAMIGVVIDYVEHFLAHRMMSPVGTESSEVLHAIRPSLRLAALTTLVGVSGFAFAGYPGFREITIIAGVGVLAGLLTTTLVVARIVGPHEGPTRLQLAAARASRRIVGVLRVRRNVFVGVAAMTLVASTVALTTARTVEDPSALSGVPPGLLADDAAVRAELGSAGSVLVATRGRTCDLATASAERDVARLRAALHGASVRTVVDLVPSRATQLRRIARERNVPEADYRAALGRADFDADAFAPFFAFRAARDESFVSLPELADAAPFLFGSRVVRSDDGCRVVSTVQDADVRAVRTALSGSSDSAVVDTHELQVGSYRTIRSHVLAASAAGCLAVFLICLVRYRELRRTIVACTPAWLSAIAAVAIASCFHRLDLLHGLGALLVVSMGTDYGIFFVDSVDEGDAVDATFASVVVSALTTILSFGMLGWSHHPALASLGLTTALGVTLAVLLAPAALALVRKETP